MLGESEELGWVIASTLDRSGHLNGCLGDWLDGTRSLVGTQSAIAKHQTDAMAKTKADDVQLSDKKRHFAWLKKNGFIWDKWPKVGGWGRQVQNFYKSLFWGIFDHYMRLIVNFFVPNPKYQVPNLPKSTWFQVWVICLK